MSRPFKTFGRFKKAYDNSKREDKDKLVNELIEKLSLDISKLSND